MTNSNNFDMLGIQRPALAILKASKPSEHRDDNFELNDLEPITSPKASSSAILTRSKKEIREYQITEEELSVNISPNNNTENIDEDSEFPDGGLEAYSVVFGALCATFIVFGFMNTTGAIQAYLTKHTLKDSSISSIGWMFSVYAFFAFGGGIVAGPLFDFKGSKIPMYLGSTLVVIGLFTAAESKTVYQFVLSFGVCLGFGTAFIFTCVFGTVAQWFHKKKATALGLVSIGGGIGGVIWPLMLRSLFPKIGFTWSIRIIGFIAILFLGCSCLLVKNRITKGNVPTGAKQLLSDSFVLKDLYRDKVYASFAASLFLCEFTFIMTTSYISSYVIDAGYSESESFLVLITLNAVSILGRYVPNYLGDKIGSFNMMCITSSFTAFFMLVLWLPFGQSLKIMYAFAASQGFFALSVISLAPVCCAEISKTEDFGKRYGTVYFLVAFGNLISLPIGGAIIGNGGIGYKHLVILECCLQVVSSVLWCLTRYLAVGPSLRKKF